MNKKPRDKRRHGKAPQDQRSEGQRDRDRILYSSALRRLVGVTQVVSPSEGHVFHNRLTHSLEVAQIARRIGEKFENIDGEQAELVKQYGGVDSEVCEAAALAHDLGHPPFGHIAEDELDKLARKRGLVDGFEGNAQSFRIITKLSAHPDTNFGLNLIRATLNAVLKYPWLRDFEDPQSNNLYFRKFGAYYTESDDFKWAREGFGETRHKTLEADIMDYADSIAYSIHDLEDFYRAGLIPLGLLASDTAEYDKFIDAWTKKPRYITPEDMI